MLFSAAATGAGDVWAVGERQDRDGRFATLVEHFDGRTWSVVPSPDPGTSGNHFDAVAAGGPDDVWAVGQRDDAASDQPLVEHWDGRHWSVVPVGVPGALFDAVTVHNGQVWAAGQTDNATAQGRPLVAHLRDGRWETTVLTGIGGAFTNLTGIAATDRTVWTVGTFFDPVTGNQHTLVARHDADGWHAVDAPSPGTGDAVLGAVSAAGADVWAGFAKTDGRDPLVEHHRDR